LKEIAELIEKGLASLDEFKQYISHICTEAYPDAERHEEEKKDIEVHWPRFDENCDATDGTCVWGDTRSGRIPSFVYNDRSFQQVQADAESRTQEASAYKAKYLKAFQYSQARCQHHMHPISKVTQKRVIPHACRPVGRKNKIECKHGAPWVEKLNYEGPLLICKKIAKRRNLRCSGNRNVLGTILGRRNDEWLNGTSHALCVGFAGSNSDVSPCDHVPITARTHEDSVCKGNCIKKRRCGR
jgi:hypothetical protein